MAIQSATSSPSASNFMDIMHRALGLDGQVARGGAKNTTTTAPRFDAADLYGRGGPTARDIVQDDIGDCYFVATLGAVANQNPGAIRNAISYDARTQSFNVTLHQNGRPVTVNVTQADLNYNISRNGGSSVDNTGRDGPVWPAVMETAAAKLLDTNHRNGLREGFDSLNEGGKARNAMETITGWKGRDFTYSRGMFETENAALDRLGNQAQTALANGRPLTLSTDPERRSIADIVAGREGTQDGLADNHVYVVESARKVNGEWQVTLRNPWASNNAGEGRDSNSPTITVNLRDLTRTGGLEYFNAGAAR
jgi:Calpain family cysteine protease